MALSVRTRFIAISVTITAIGLSLFANVIYDKAILYKHYLEKESYRVLTEQLITQVGADVQLQAIKNILRTNITAPGQPAQLFAVSNGEPMSEVFENTNNTALLSADLNQAIQMHYQSGELEGEFEHNRQRYYWLKRDLSVQGDSGLTLVAAYPLSASAVSETLTFFGTPLFIAGFLLLWCMVWASIILSSLVTKLQNQKQILSDQAADIVKARDEALLANQAKSIFLANMSHEIRTPLTSIIGFAESCLDANQSMNERYKATDTIIRSGRHLLHIINEVLDVSKIEAGKLDIEIRPVYLVDLLQEVNMYVKVLAEEKGLVFSISNTFPLPRIIKTDQLRLKQILLNLCSNAIKFTELGYVFLNVSFHPQHNRLRLEVVDTGIGLTEEQLAIIFNPFQQADSSITRKYGGTGLGLTLSRQLAERLGGELTVQSAPNKGSQFTVEIAVDTVDTNDYIYEADYDVIVTRENLIKQEQPAVRGKILLAEDNKDIQALVNMFISKIGAELDIVDNGRMAIEMVGSGKYDLVLLDLQMPVMGGLEAVEEMRRKGYDKPVVAMTANAMQKDKEDCLAAGFDGFISKPINKNELYSVILEYLEEAEGAQPDDSCITSLLLIDEPETIDLVNEFIARLPILVAEINDAFEKQSWDEFSGKIHQLKGVGGGYGYPIITKVSQKIEFQMTGKNYAQVAVLVRELNKLKERIIAGKDENYKLIH